MLFRVVSWIVFFRADTIHEFTTHSHEITRKPVNSSIQESLEPRVVWRSLMSTSKSIALTFAFLLFASSSPLSAQEPTTRAKTDRSNLEVQVHLLVATSDAAAKDTVPQALQPFV